MQETASRRLTKTLGVYAILSVIGVTMLLPFLWMVSTSLKEPRDVFNRQFSIIPRPAVIRNYVAAWTSVSFGRFYLNSIFQTFAVTAGQLVTSSLAAYAFARLRFPGRDALFFGYISTMMVPFAVTMIPVYVLMEKLHWIDTYKALILPGMFSAYGTFLLRQFFLTLPVELEEAAKIDGCNLFAIYTRITLPLSKPALATLATFTFLTTWRSFMWPLIVINSEQMKTIPIGLASFQDAYGTEWGLLMAGSVIALFPALVIFVYNQRFFEAGIQVGGLRE